MKICLDVDYRDDHAVAAAVLFGAWDQESPDGELVERVAPVEPYVPGQFFRRELPCLLAVLGKVGDPLDLVIVDGYVWLGDETHPGLGGHLFGALGGAVAVVGVAKSLFRSATQAVGVLRGEEATRPLFVTAAGIEVQEAARLVRSMHGANRIPTLLKRVDSLCRQAFR